MALLIHTCRYFPIILSILAHVFLHVCSGFEEEAKVGFHEHVFLAHLVTDFPKGPIRHFMELVAAGLSQNPYLSVREKHAHIDWYRQFFQDKQKLVDELVEAATEQKAVEQS